MSKLSKKCGANMAKSGKKDLYQQVTDRMLEELKNGVKPWAKPWAGGHLAVSHTTGGAYSFLNQMLISMSGVGAGEYLTFQQALKEGGNVRKGEKSAVIMFFTMDYRTKEQNDDGTETTIVHEYSHPVLKEYHVFEVSQCEGIERKHTTDAAAVSELPIVATAEDAAAAYLRGAGIAFEHQNCDVACYYPAADKIVLPQMGQFTDSPRYYSTLFHEMTHSTGAEKRLARDLSGRFGSRSYAREELVAEMGAAYLSAILGTADDESVKASASYIDNWSRALQEDNALVIYAAARAQKAAEYILSFNK